MELEMHTMELNVRKGYMIVQAVN